MSAAPLLERLFRLKEAGTRARTEVLAGATTFLTMAYIVVVNPAVLSQAGMPVGGVAVATCLAAGIGSILMGLLSNYPLALAPGMGLNAYFTYTVVKGMGVPWTMALGCVFLSGVGFLLLTLVGARKVILNAIPRSLFAAVGGGIGLFIAFIGLKNAGIIVSSPATTVALGKLTDPGAALSLAGLAIITLLQARRIPGAILLGVLATTAIAWGLGMVHVAPGGYGLKDLSATALRLDVPGALAMKGGGVATGLEIVFVFLFVDLFENVGTLVAVTQKTGIVPPVGPIPRLNRIFLADSFATMIGALAGVSTVTSYIESAAGVAAGGRTGLTSVVAGALFLLTVLFTPWVQAVPASATAPVLILVGALMAGSLAEVEWGDPLTAVPAFLTLVTIPLTYSIANGLAFGVVSYAVLKLCMGRVVRQDWFLLVLAALFAARFVYMATG